MNTKTVIHARAASRLFSLIAMPLLVASASAAVIYEELFTTQSNANLSTAIGWTGYGFNGTTSADISSVAAANTLFVSGGASNPDTHPTGYLAAILGNTDASNPNRYSTYVAYETGLDLNLADATVSWRMNGGVSNTVRVRFLVQVGGEWYASAISDTAQKYFAPSAYGTGADFSSGGDALAKSLTLSSSEATWEKVSLNFGSGTVTFTALTQDLALDAVTGIGFHILGGGTGRIDTLQITGIIPEPRVIALFLGMGALVVALGWRRGVRLH